MSAMIKRCWEEMVTMAPNRGRHPAIVLASWLGGPRTSLILSVGMGRTMVHSIPQKN